MGYGGFIHNFKNFVLRGEQIYFIRAQQELSSIYRSIDKFSQFELSEKESQSIDTIRNTVDQYAAKLLNESIQDKSRENIAKLDKIVEVDDTQAEQALDVLRMSLHDSYQRTMASQALHTEEVTIFIKLGAYFLSPIVCLVALLNMLMLWFMHQLLKERTALIEVMSDSVIYYDKGGRIWQVNDVGQKQFGYSKKEFIKMTMADLLPSHFNGATFLKQVKHSFNHPQLVDTERDTCVVGVHKNGTKKRYRISITTILNGDGQFYIAVMHDLSEEQALLEKAHLDYLTGVYNRRQAYSLLERELARLNRYHRPLAILLVDLDNFKPLNDKEGHLAGDIALKELCIFL
ncbi:diguanylate cyclase [Pseudoalteromonas sp. JBTF-M23]|uniref:Diguanylate cyclase n=1 Tax=Pseudoalteromonas caenipelagi TaxID=2726988 RepID=A0A849VAA1_9GAMM|nr:diguanylate cyclase [Pseudoalteromonas caenipelagi]